MSAIALIGTCDSKLQELLFLRQKILEAGAGSVILVDVGRTLVEHDSITITQRMVVQSGLDPNQDVTQLTRGDMIKFMTANATICIKKLFEQGKFSGIISAGGSCGSSLACPVMRNALPIGFPKFMISTVASGDTGPLVGETDLVMMYSVVDVSGANPLLARVFNNAAHAIVGMARAQMKPPPSDVNALGKKRIGISMFGVTTPGVDVARQYLESKLGTEVYIFHATGHGGQAMERLVRAGELDAVLDMTTTEICDLLMGGNMSAGPRRLEAAAESGIPYIVSTGALDMVNFPAKAMVPAKYTSRRLFEHNPTVTLMRTNKEECQNIGNFIAGKLRAFAKRPSAIKVVLPRGGISLIATPGAVFSDRDADEALFEAIHKGLEGTGIEVIDDERDINNKGFAESIAQHLIDIIQSF